MTSWDISENPNKLYLGDQPQVTLVNDGPNTVYFDAIPGVDALNGFELPPTGQMTWKPSQELWVCTRTIPGQRTKARLRTNPAGELSLTTRAKFYKELYRENLGSGQPHYATEIMADTPAAWWRFDELGVPGVAADSSGNGRNGTYGIPANTTLGVVGATTVNDGSTAADCTALTTALLDVPYGAYMDAPAGLTLEIWIKTTAALASRQFFTRTGGGASFQYCLEMQVDGKLTFSVRTVVGGFTTSAATVLAYNDGLYHHIVGTYDGANMKLYVDGDLKVTTAKTGVISTTANAMAIGGRSSQMLPGVFDEAAIYGTALSAARIAAHYLAALNAFSSGAPMDTKVIETGHCNTIEVRRETPNDSNALSELTVKWYDELLTQISMDYVKCYVGAYLPDDDNTTPRYVVTFPVLGKFMRIVETSAPLTGNVRIVGTDALLPSKNDGGVARFAPTPYPDPIYDGATAIIPITSTSGDIPFPNLGMLTRFCFNNTGAASVVSIHDSDNNLIDSFAVGVGVTSISENLTINKAFYLHVDSGALDALVVITWPNLDIVS